MRKTQHSQSQTKHFTRRKQKKHGKIVAPKWLDIRK